MGTGKPITCVIRYTLDQRKLADFKRYAEAWTSLISRYGGKHQGYFSSVPSPTKQVSFPGLGRDGPTDVVLATFSFPDLTAYEAYRRAVKADPSCAAAEAIVRETGCILGYERMFLEPLKSEETPR